jgi:2-(1,2-epoxy-1,2-dihydrophenyl)acetyl-CoA isomerase
MTYQTLILQKEDGVATITLNRPDKLNAWNIQLITEVIKALDEIDQDDTARTVILTGAGRAFCAGGDLSLPLFDMTGYSPEMKDFFHKVNMIPLCLKNLRKPVIAAVNGPAMGAGCAMAMACDIIIASEVATFGTAFVNVGYHPDAGASYFLPRLVGVNKACELIFTGKTIDASEAERIGLVNQVVPADALLATAKELAVRLANGPSLAIGLAKSCIYNGLQLTLEQALENEAQAACLILQTEDQKEGTKAFREKRKPRYRGR